MYNHFVSSAALPRALGEIMRNDVEVYPLEELVEGTTLRPSLFLCWEPDEVLAGYLNSDGPTGAICDDRPEGGGSHV